MEQIIAKKRTKDEWDDVMTDMVQKGAEGKDEEFDAIVAYLTKNFGLNTRRFAYKLTAVN